VGALRFALEEARIRSVELTVVEVWQQPYLSEDVRPERRILDSVWSWPTLLLEIFRWKHVTTSLRFNSGRPIPGPDIRPHPGQPLIVLYTACALAPLAFITVVIVGARSRPSAALCGPDD
jgi:hypothetical protein